MRQILPKHQDEVDSLKKAREILIREVGEEIQGYLSDLSDEVLSDDELSKYSSVQAVEASTESIAATVEELVKQGVSAEMLRFYLYDAGFKQSDELSYWLDRFMPLEKRYPHLKKEGDDILLEGKNGTWIGTLEYMRRSALEMTDDQYLDLLAKNLDTPEKLHIYFAVFMKYRHDRGDFTKVTAALKEDHRSEYTQSPRQTINRLENGQMLGDCDDYAFLATEILQRQGKQAYTMLIPSHAITVWIEKKGGRWHASTMGTFGLDQNGNRYGWPPDPTKSKGYTDLTKAINSVLEKYDEADLGLPEGADGYRINTVASLLQLHEIQTVIWSYDLPVDILADYELVQQLLHIRKLTQIRDFEPAFAALMKLKKSHKGDELKEEIFENLLYRLFNDADEGSVSLEYLEQLRVEAERQFKVEGYRANFAGFYRVLREKMQKVQKAKPTRAAELKKEIQSLYDIEIALREKIIKHARIITVYDYDTLIQLYVDQGRKEDAQKLKQEKKKMFPSSK